MKFAEAKRKRPNDNAMDTSALAREAESGIPGDDHSGNYYDDGAWWWDEPDYYGADVNAMGYGKGKSKGKSYGGYNSGGGKSYGKGGDKGKSYSKGGYKGSDKGKGKGKGKDSGGGSVNIKRNAAGVAIFVGDCHNCGLRGRSSRNCPSAGGQYAHFGTCGKSGIYGHKVEVCLKQLEAVEAVGVHQAAGVPQADCVEMGGDSSEICGVDVHNRYAGLDEDHNEEKMVQSKSWEYYRTYYENRSAPPPYNRNA